MLLNQLAQFEIFHCLLERPRMDCLQVKLASPKRFHAMVFVIASALFKSTRGVPDRSLCLFSHPILLPGQEGADRRLEQERRVRSSVNRTRAAIHWRRVRGWDAGTTPTISHTAVLGSPLRMGSFAAALRIGIDS